MLIVMKTETKQSSVTDQHFANLYQTIMDNNDVENADRIVDIYEKHTKQEVMISFAGHFSAGKSSMINELLGKAILPKSPIPTSANIVKIRSGEGTARVYFNNGDPLEYKEPYDIDMIKGYAQDKASIKEIEISTKEPIVPDDCVLIDTPGIDAADDADRLMTESSLHITDALFYVMDYNHVQSEVNLVFLKKVQGSGIPFYIIINQIDKHDEAEIPFNSFEKNIKQTFDQWGLHPDKTFFSSLMDKTVGHNQLLEIKATLFTIMTTEKDSIFTIERSLNNIIKAHKNYLTEVYEERVAQLPIHNDGEQDKLSDELIDINNTIMHIKNRPQKIENTFLNDLNTTLNNAYVMTAELRDKAQLFLESQQKGFKVGIFGSTKKTEDERKARLNNFLESLLTIVETSIQWKLRDKFSNLMQQYNLYNKRLLQRIQHITIDYKSESLLSLVKPGAKVNGDYVLNYTNDVSSDIKKKYRKEALQLWELIHEHLITGVNDELAGYEQKQSELQALYDGQLRQKELDKSLQNKYESLTNALNSGESDPYSWKMLNEALHLKNRPIKQSTERINMDEAKTIEDSEEKSQEKGQSCVSADNILESADKTIETIERLPGFESIVESLKRKQHRLNDRTYTIALFGAFSAGKSSFANALMGKAILPVSPNPTTAVINRINPVSDEFKHGTVVVKLKDEQTLADDLLLLTKNLRPPTEDFDKLISWMKQNNIDQSSELGKTQQTYLHAMMSGYADIKKYLADEITITIQEFADYVTDESKACYIESIDLYYDCNLTREGITLVDTPGADSVNARHTNVAFDYIKHADAILYVTYYNHALSRADKDFLLQLGRVKDAFQLDKMFFIMNAADLAENNTELNMVLKYVENQLTHLGIRFPRLYPVSSRKSLHNKLNNDVLNVQMANFEEAFHHFIHDELAALTIQSVHRDMIRASQALHHFIESLQLNADEKERYVNELNSKRESLENLVETINHDIYTQKIAQKLEKQLFYVLERLSIRFHDMFKETFNPATIKGSGKQASIELENCLRSLLDYTGYELVQELRAVSLRIEALIKDFTHDVHQEFSNQSNQIDAKFILPDFDEVKLDTPEYEKAFSNVGIQTFQKELKSFNGTKAFFAKNEKEIMKDNIYERLYPLANDYINENHQKMRHCYIEQWNQLLTGLKQEVYKNIQLYSDSHLSMVTNQSFNLETLQEKQRVLSSIVVEQEKTEVQ